MNNNDITLNIFKFKNDLSSLINAYSQTLPVGVVYLTFQQTYNQIQKQYKEWVVTQYQLEQQQQNKEENNSNSQD